MMPFEENRALVFIVILLCQFNIQALAKKSRAYIRTETIEINENVEVQEQKSGFTEPRTYLNNNKHKLQTPFPQIHWPELANKVFTDGHKTYAMYKGYKLLLTIDPKIQKIAYKHIKDNHNSFGATTIIEPSTGRILAIVEKAQKNFHKRRQLSVSAIAPAASLSKYITAVAAIEKNNLKANSIIRYRGGCSKLNSKNWIKDKKFDNQTMSLALAFGVSCNTVFARLAVYDVGLASLSQYIEKFMFNKPIISDINFETSLFILPEAHSATFLDVAEAGAGFGITRITPIHSALFSAAIANNGIMMSPHIVEAAYDDNGNEVYRAKPVEVSRLMTQSTANEMKILMKRTISSGPYNIRVGKRKRQHISKIGGKTGTLSDPENRSILYTWFSGLAPIVNQDESISIATLIGSPQNWIIRASKIAQKTLVDYLSLN